MARGKTLGECLTALRTKLRLSLSVAANVGVRETHVKVLQQTQEWLAENYSWPHLRVERFIQPQAGQRYYDPAGCKKLDSLNALVAAGDVKVDNIAALYLRDGDLWRPLCPGINNQHFNQWDSDVGERAWPIEHWQISEDNIELWPIPDQTGDESTLIDMIKVVARRNLGAFAEESDTADLDDQALILFTAAELDNDQKRAQRLLAQGQQRMRDLRANANPRKRVQLFGNAKPERTLRGPPTVYYRTI